LCDWNRVEGNWKQVKGKVKEKWGKLTDDDLTAINGRRDQLDPRALLDLRPHCGCGNGLRARPREEIIEAQ
jgi:hypothetical protein